MLKPVLTALEALRERRRMPRRWRQAVIELCDGMSSELAAGRTPDEAFTLTAAHLDPPIAAQLLNASAPAPGPRSKATALTSPENTKHNPSPKTPPHLAEGNVTRTTVHALPRHLRPTTTGVGRPRAHRAPRTHPTAPSQPQRALGVGELDAALAARQRAAPPTPSGAEASAAIDSPELRPRPIDRLEKLALQPGAEGLRLLAACWRIAAEQGGTLAAVLDDLATALRDEESNRQEIATQLAGPRATARLLSVLPLLGLAMAAALDADPMAFLLGTLPGLGCLVLGVGLNLTGLWWTHRLARSAEEIP
ncbi:type II secretion system F family protein [Actinomadura sp. NBRC 104412]|uniref:type II secretion system F family protein n=1 Tax=Actinomadura sp. NBRC 104412 TaxID=3032203 RepID=UPI002556ED51|nr:type II secretion system F family protein [Actinomadura sp. NBRC 104412]